MQKTLITGSTTPDIDAVACALGYQHYLSQKDDGNTYIAGTQDGMHPEASFVCEKLGLSCHNMQKSDIYDTYILVDASAKHGLPDCVNFSAVQEVIDHRMFPDYEVFPHAKFRIEPVGAAATQIAEFFYFDRTVSISPAIAQLLLCAIYSNTINFKADVTTFRDHRMKQWLENFVEDKYLYEQMFAYKTSYIINHLEEVLLAEDKTIDTNMKLFQLELYDVAVLLKHDTLQKMTQNIAGTVPYIIVILQDIKIGQTSLLAFNDTTKTLIEKSGLPGSWNGSVWQIPHIMMRKTIIPYLKK